MQRCLMLEQLNLGQHGRFITHLLQRTPDGFRSQCSGIELHRHSPGLFIRAKLANPIKTTNGRANRDHSATAGYARHLQLQDFHDLLLLCLFLLSITAKVTIG